MRYKNIEEMFNSLSKKVFSEQPRKSYTIMKKVTDPNKFLKILIQSNVDMFALSNYDFEITETTPHHYHIVGNHPTLARIDIINSEAIFV